MIRKIVRRSFFKNKISFIGIAVLIILAIAISVMGNITVAKLENNHAQYIEQSNQEDFAIYTVPEIPGQLEYDEADVKEKLEKEYDIYIEERTFRDVYVTDTEKILRTYVYDPSDEINMLQIVDGNMPQNSNEIAITDAYAVANNLSVGDEINISGTSFNISGIVFAPDYILAISSSSIVPDNASFGVGYVTPEGNDRIDSEVVETVYYSGIFNDPNLPMREKESIYEQIKKEYKIYLPIIDERGQITFNSNGTPQTEESSLVIAIVDASENLKISTIETEIESQKIFFNIISIVIFLIAIFIIITFIRNLLTRERRNFGLLSAEGYSMHSIALTYLRNIIFITITGTIIGIILGYAGSSALYNMYMTYYSLPNVSTLQNDLTVPLIIVIIEIVIFLIIAYLVGIKPLEKQSVLSLISNVDESTLKNRPRNLTWITKRLSFKNKIRFNILFRRFKLTALLVFTIFFSSFLLLFGAIMLSSITKVINETYGTVYTYDYEVLYKDGHDGNPDALNHALSYVIYLDDVEYANDPSKRYTPSDDDGEDGMQMYGINPENEYINLENEQGEPITAETLESGVVMTKLVSELYDLEVGDTLYFYNPVQSKSDEYLEVEIVDVAAVYTYPYLYYDIDQMEELIGVPDGFYTAEFGEGNIEEDLPYEALFYFQVSKLVDNIEKTMGMLYFFIGFIGALAFIISLIVLSMLSGVIINDNRKLFSVMKVMGYHSKEINLIIYLAYLPLITLIYIVSIPLIIQIFQIIIKIATSNMDLTVPIYVHPVIAVLGLFIILGSFTVAIIINNRRIKKINLAEAIKADKA